MNHAIEKTKPLSDNRNHVEGVNLMDRAGGCRRIRGSYKRNGNLQFC